MIEKNNEFGFQWHISDRCNMRCTHCYQDDYSSKNELDLSSMKSIADTVFNEMKDRNISVNITGGEPFLMPSLFGLIGYLHDFNNLKEINIITNGSIASAGICNEIKRFPKIGSLKVSIESGNQSVNDAIRGAGALGRVLNGIDTFRNRTNKSIVLMMTLGKYNVDTICGTVELARDWKVSGIIFERFIPMGAGQHIAREVLGPGEWSKAVRAIAKAAGMEAESEDLLPYKAFWIHFNKPQDENLEGAFCNLGKDSMAIMPNGDVFPCRRLPVLLGNLLKNSYKDIMINQESFEGKRIKEKLHGDICPSCGIGECAGCRALALALTGDLFADDTQCVLNLF